jgi:hypothetical protein
VENPDVAGPDVENSDVEGPGTNVTRLPQRAASVPGATPHDVRSGIG